MLDHASHDETRYGPISSYTVEGYQTRGGAARQSHRWARNYSRARVRSDHAIHKAKRSSFPRRYLSSLPSLPSRERGTLSMPIKAETAAFLASRIDAEMAFVRMLSSFGQRGRHTATQRALRGYPSSDVGGPASGVAARGGPERRGLLGGRAGKRRRRPDHIPRP